MRQHKHHSAPATLSYSSVEQVPNAKGNALFITDSSKVFNDEIDINSITLFDYILSHPIIC